MRREGDNKKIFYYCARHYRKWDGKACGFRKFISARWDEYVWDCVHALLSDDAWMEEQLAGEQKAQEGATKLVEVEERKLNQLHSRITRVQAGYEDGIYDTMEAKKRIKVCQEAITVAETAIARRQREAGAPGASETGIASLRQRLESIRHANLESASFDERVQMLGLLDIKVYPSEDMKTVRIASRIGANPDSVNDDQGHCGKVLFAPLVVSIGGTGSVYHITSSLPFTSIRLMNVLRNALLVIRSASSSMALRSLAWAVIISPST